MQEGGEKGMSLPFEPCTLTFSELHYLVPLPPQQADSPNAVTGLNGKELELLKVCCPSFACCYPARPFGPVLS